MAHVKSPAHPAGSLYDCPGCYSYERAKVARRAQIDPEDVAGDIGEWTIDGMDADDWISAMYER